MTYSFYHLVVPFTIFILLYFYRIVTSLSYNLCIFNECKGCSSIVPNKSAVEKRSLRKSWKRPCPILFFMWQFSEDSIVELSIDSLTVTWRLVRTYYSYSEWNEKFNRIKYFQLIVQFFKFRTGTLESLDYTRTWCSNLGFKMILIFVQGNKL